MKRHLPLLLRSTFAAATLMLGGAAQAAPVNYDIDWTGANGYTMTGSFSFDDASAGDGRIVGSELLTLNLQGFTNGTLFASFDLVNLGLAAATFNFNFDPVAEAFFTGGDSQGPSGQNWNCDSNGSGLGFGSTTTFQGLCQSGNSISASTTVLANARLTATREATEVPEPATLMLLGAGLLGLGAARRRRRVL